LAHFCSMGWVQSFLCRSFSRKLNEQCARKAEPPLRDKNLPACYCNNLAF